MYKLIFGNNLRPCFCSTLLVASAAAHSLSVGLPPLQEEATPSVQGASFLSVIASASLNELLPSYPMGTASPCRWRYNFDNLGEMFPVLPPTVYYEVGRIGVVFFAHQHLAMLVELNKAIAEARVVELSGSDFFELPEDNFLVNRVEYVVLDSEDDVLCMHLAQAMTLRSQLVEARPRIDAIADEFLKSQRSVGRGYSIS